MTCDTPFVEDAQKWNFEGCHILQISKKFGFVKKNNTFDLECLKQMLGRKDQKKRRRIKEERPTIK